MSMVTGVKSLRRMEDKQENEFSVQHGFRILSAYTTSAGEKIWIIIEADRSATTMLLPNE